MDLLDRMEKSAFLGREWLVWLWFKSELFQGPFALADHGQVEVWLETQLTLEAEAQSLEKSALRGPAPSVAPEAHEGLRQGKLPTGAGIGIRQGEQTFACSFKADAFSLSAVRLPTLVQEQTDEKFYERMFLLEQLESMLEALFDEFLELRLSKRWESDLLPAIRAWVAGSPSMDSRDYEQLLRSVRKGSSALEAMGVVPAAE